MYTSTWQHLKQKLSHSKLALAQEHSRMFLADKHNFGQQVEKVQRGSDIWYRKPRTVYWEWLFFGKASPLKSLFDEKAENGNRPLAEYFFNLDIEVESTWSGYAKEVATENQTPTLEHFYAFGALIAYCHIFGIRDLHKQNLIMTKTHLQAVDAEVVFTALTLPHETLLLPFKNVGYEFAGIGALVNSKEELTQVQVQQILLGYWDLFSLVSKSKVETDGALAALDFLNMPMRVIIRNTSEYRNLLESPPDNILLSEVEQMKRGDVPFYFKFAANKKLYWLKEKEVVQTEDSVGIFQRDVDRHAHYSSSEFCSTRATVNNLVVGLLFLIKHFGVQHRLRLSEEAFIRDGAVSIRDQTFKM